MQGVLILWIASLVIIIMKLWLEAMLVILALFRILNARRGRDEVLVGAWAGAVGLLLVLVLTQQEGKVSSVFTAT